MHIAELAGRAGVKVSTIRFYERRGLLRMPERTSAGYRQYDDAAVTHLRYLRRGQELGFTLAELAEIGELSDRMRSGGVTASEVAETAERKLRELDDRIEDLRRTRAAITQLLESQCADPSAPCPVVAALGHP